MAKIKPRSVDDPEAQIAPFADPKVAERISRMIDAGLAESGAEDVTAKYRPEGRVAQFDNGTYLLPTVLHCESPEHGMANREFLFPFASVVQVDAKDLPDCLGSSLVVTCISNDPSFRARFVASPHVDRLNFGPLSTTQIGWDQPHEGNLFEHLYARRAIQRLA